MATRFRENAENLAQEIIESRYHHIRYRCINDQVKQEHVKKHERIQPEVLPDSRLLFPLETAVRVHRPMPNAN